MDEEVRARYRSDTSGTETMMNTGKITVGLLALLLAGVAFAGNDVTLTIVSHDPDPSEAGYGTLVTVDVDVPGGFLIAGDITVTDGTDSCAAALPETSCVLIPLTPGTKSITASWPGDDLFGPAESEPVSHEVVPATMPELISRGRTESPYGNGDSGETLSLGEYEFARPGISISADGRWTAFETAASNLLNVEHLQGVIELDRQTGDSSSIGYSWPSYSSDGRFLGTSGQYFIGPHPFRSNKICSVFDRNTMTTTEINRSLINEEKRWISPICYEVSTSPDGDQIAMTMVVERTTHPITEPEIVTWNIGGPIILGDEFSGIEGHQPSLSSPGDVAYVRGDDIIVNLDEVVSVDSLGNPANGPSFYPSISADARYVAFSSDAFNLVPGDSNNTRDIFVHDRDTGVTSRVSVDSMGAQSDGDCDHPSISSDGILIAFDCEATNLVPNDSNEAADIFVRHMINGRIERASVDRFGQEGNGASTYPAIAGDGGFVAFSSEANNLVLNDGNAHQDVFVAEVPDLNFPPVAISDAYVIDEDTSLVADDADGSANGDPNDNGVLANDSDPESSPLEVISNLEPFTADGIGGTVDMAADGTFTYLAPADTPGMATFSYDVYDGSATSTGMVTITVNPVNDPPSFTPGPDIEVPMDSGLYFTLWATNIAPGPPDESAQSISFDVQVVATTHTVAFDADPDIDSDGILFFTPTAGTAGVATVEVTLMDNGGGDDTSAPVQFSIIVSDTFFKSGFDVSN